MNNITAKLLKILESEGISIYKLGKRLGKNQNLYEWQKGKRNLTEKSILEIIQAINEISGKNYKIELKNEIK